MAKPFLRYAGGKRQLLPALRDILPDDFGTYYEPFVGGGAFLFEIEPQNAIINDINRTLMLTYYAITKYFEDIVAEVLNMLPGFNKAQYERNRAEYNRIRHVTKQEKMSKAEMIRLVSLFIYLNRTCWNGLWRENKSGNFNTPIGSFANGPTLDVVSLQKTSGILSKSKMLCGDFEIAVAGAQPGDLVYCDPPYAPITKTSFTEFTSHGFSQDDHFRLARVVHELAERGVYVILSNNLTPLTTSLYQDLNINIFNERRNINSDTTSRGNTQTIIVTNFRK